MNLKTYWISSRVISILSSAQSQASQCFFWCNNKTLLSQKPLLNNIALHSRKKEVKSAHSKTEFPFFEKKIKNCQWSWFWITYKWNAFIARCAIVLFSPTPKKKRSLPRKIGEQLFCFILNVFFLSAQKKRDAFYNFCIFGRVFIYYTKFISFEGNRLTNAKNKKKTRMKKKNYVNAFGGRLTQ